MCGMGTGLSSAPALQTSASRISVQSQPHTSAAFSRAAKLEPCGTTTVPYFRLTTLAQPLACQRSRRDRSFAAAWYARSASRVTPRPRRSPYIPMVPWPPCLPWSRRWRQSGRPPRFSLPPRPCCRPWRPFRRCHIWPDTGPACSSRPRYSRRRWWDPAPWLPRSPHGRNRRGQGLTA